MGEEIIKVLDYLGTQFGIAIDWSDKNVMPYLQELANKYIHYELATSIAFIVTGIVMFFISVRTLKKRYKAALLLTKNDTTAKNLLNGVESYGGSFINAVSN